MLVVSPRHSLLKYSLHFQVLLRDVMPLEMMVEATAVKECLSNLMRRRGLWYSLKHLCSSDASSCRL